MSSSNCCFLTCIQASWEPGKVVWYFHLFKNFPQFILTHRVKGFTIVNEADFFLEFSCFFYDPRKVDNLISGSSAFSKSILSIWKFLGHILLKPNLEDFEHYLASKWNEYNCTGIWTFSGIAFGIRMKTDLFQSCGRCWAFHVCWCIECCTLAAASFRIWKSSAGIPSPPLALFTVMLPKPTWLRTPGCLALGEWPHHHDYLGH